MKPETFKSYEFYHRPIPVNSYKTVYRGYKRISKRGREFRDNMEKTLKSMKLTPTSEPLFVFVDLYFRTGVAGDTDNYMKCIFDSLEGHLYNNDKQIISFLPSKHVKVGYDKIKLATVELKRGNYAIC